MKLPDWTEADADVSGDYREEMTHSRQLATAVVEVFEDLLDDHGIFLPDDDVKAQTKGMTDAQRNKWRIDNCIAPLYGCQYDDLVSAVSERIENYLEKL
jgi:hypothetical protein